MKRKLSLIHRTWRRLFITAVIGFLCFLNRLVGLHPRARIHWLGGPQRPRRLERPLLYLLFPIAMLLLKPREYATWAAIFGGFTAMMVPIISIRYILRAHWFQ
jgi:hypothetical protein